MLPSKPWNRTEKARRDALHDSTCLACRLRGIRTPHPEVHHLLSGGRRIGHMATIALCTWHHRGVPPFGRTVRAHRQVYGPSLMDGAKTFREAYGHDTELLTLQNEVLAAEAKERAL